MTIVITRPPPILMIHIGFKGTAAQSDTEGAALTAHICSWHIARPMYHLVEARHPMSHCIMYDLLHFPYC